MTEDHNQIDLPHDPSNGKPSGKIYFLTGSFLLREKLAKDIFQLVECLPRSHTISKTMFGDDFEITDNTIHMLVS